MPLTRPFLLFVGTLTAIHLPAAAQAIARPDSQNRNCPITFYAEPRFPSGITLVEPSPRDRAGVHLHLEDPVGRPIRSAEVTLHGIPATRGAQPAALGTSTPLTQTFHVVSGASDSGTLTATLWLARAVTIERVSVTAVHFSNAPAWQASRSSSCIAVPSGNRLLGSLR